MPTPHEKLRIAQARTADGVWVNKLLQWINGAHSTNESLIKTELAVWVEEYSPQLQKGVNLRATALNEQVTLH
jgi:hypothetical protein